jgi:hypothetical protein
MGFDGEGVAGTDVVVWTVVAAFVDVLWVLVLGFVVVADAADGREVAWPLACVLKTGLQSNTKDAQVQT